MPDGQASSSGNTIRWAIRAPRLFDTASAFKAEWQRNTIRELAPVAAWIKTAAQRAYVGTRFAAAFVVTRQSTPVTAVKLVNTHPLFTVVEYPTRPHTIVPRNGRFLVFQVGGRTVFARSVHHPGTRGRLAIDRVFQDAETAFTDALIRATGAMLRGL
jgi:hypothetical protein